MKRSVILAVMLMASCSVVGAALDCRDVKWSRPSEHAVLTDGKLRVKVPNGVTVSGCVGVSGRLPQDKIIGSSSLRMHVKCRMKNVARPKVSYLGLKLQFVLKNEVTGEMRYVDTDAPKFGDFDWRDIGVSAQVVGVDFSRVDIMVGLQGTSGEVEFDLSTFAVETGGALFPIANHDYKVSYSSAVCAWPQMCGVMLPGLRNVTEKDFADLERWGVSLVRYQMTRQWGAKNQNRDLDEYDKWIMGRLDHLEQVLKMAGEYGMKVVIDVHVPPGGRNASNEMNMFYEKEYRDYFVGLWRRIATRFKGNANVYGYDLINEPNQLKKADFDYWTIQKDAAESIREIDDVTPIIIEANGWDSPNEFTYLSPLAMDNVIYQVHMYMPFEFTHQGVNGNPHGVSYPDAGKTWGRNYIKKCLAPVRKFQLQHNARIFVGEFSAVAWANGADEYISDCISVFNEFGWDWTYHAFREWDGWSVEHESTSEYKLIPSHDNPRRRALLEGIDCVRRRDVKSASDAERHSSGLMNPQSSMLDVGEDGELKVLFLGNSITRHVPLASIGWTNDWGMAASDESNDYVHVVIRGLESTTGKKVNAKVRTIPQFERQFATYDVDGALRSVRDFNPDYLIVAIGENVADFKSEEDETAFAHAFEGLLSYFNENGRCPRIVVRGVFWPNPKKDAILEKACRGIENARFVRADFGGDNRMCAQDLFWHEGVQSHPGDMGMKKIAAAILKGCGK